MTPTNITASVRARLTSKARETGRPFQEILQFYAMERFLYRLSVSPHASRFVLKGALMLLVWDAPSPRPTMDVDLLGRLDNSLDNLTRVVRDLCAFVVPPDGLVFDSETVKVERIAKDADHQGVRARFIGLLDRARISMQLDIGFGDTVVPEPVKVEYPTLLGHPAPNLLGYPREAAIAEKLEAMVKRGSLNSRMKDFYDVWLLARHFAFDGTTLGRAIASTFAARETPLETRPLALTAAFAERPDTQRLWSAFVTRSGLRDAPDSLAHVVGEVGAFLLPVLEACSTSAAFQKAWLPGGPWRSDADPIAPPVRLP